MEEEKNYGKYSLFELRRYAQRIGVKSATTKNKAELIKSIIAIEKGEAVPCFSKRGRPKSQSIFIDGNGEIYTIIENMQKQTDKLCEQLKLLKERCKR